MSVERFPDCAPSDVNEHVVGVQAAAESVLTPRFYTTDFDEMELLFSQELNPNLDMSELEVSHAGFLVLADLLCRLHRITWKCSPLSCT
jgi:hypothetical protein